MIAWIQEVAGMGLLVAVLFVPALFVMYTLVAVTKKEIVKRKESALSLANTEISSLKLKVKGMQEAAMIMVQRSERSETQRDKYASELNDLKHNLEEAGFTLVRPTGEAHEASYPFTTRYDEEE